jgi:Cupin superfamily protein
VTWPGPRDGVLERLVHPHTADEFLSSVWEQRHLHVTRDENPGLLGHLADIASVDDVDELLTITYAAGSRPHDSVRLGRGGVMAPPDRYLTDRTDTTARVHVGRVLDLYRAGASLILNGVHEASPPIARLCDSLAEVFGVRVHANAYLTPPNAQGFPLHADSHDVFILQVTGDKAWTIHTAPAVPLDRGSLVPMADDPVTAGPVDHVCLRAGEVLYLPRGTLHEGATSGGSSFHLTVGVTPYTWSDLLRDVVAELEGDTLDLRRSVAPRLGALAGGAVAADEEVLARLAGGLLDPDQLRRAAARKVEDEERRRHRRRPHRGELTQVVESGGLSAMTPVRVRDGSDPRIEHADGHLRLSFGGKTLTLPAFTEPHLRLLCEGGPLCAADLPPDLDEAGRLVLVRRLTFEGLLEPDPPVAVQRSPWPERRTP